MAKRKTQRRWNGLGDGLVHGYEIVVFYAITPDQLLRASNEGVPRKTLLRTFCGLGMDRWDRGIWCRKPVTCLECLALAHRILPRGMTEHAAAID